MYMLENPLTAYNKTDYCVKIVKICISTIHFSDSCLKLTYIDWLQTSYCSDVMAETPPIGRDNQFSFELIAFRLNDT
jgi:hypothetical protein